MNTLEYLNKHLILNEYEEIKNTNKNLVNKIKKSFSKNTSTQKTTHIIKNIKDINAVLFKEVIQTTDKYDNKKLELVKAFIMTNNASFYHFDCSEKLWSGPFNRPLFQADGYHQQLRMLTESSNRYYLSNGKLIDLKRFFDYSTKATLDYIPNIGFPCIFTDSLLKYSIDLPAVIDKNKFDTIDYEIIEEVFQENIQVKYKPFYKLEHLKDNDIAIRIFILDNKTCIEVFRAYIYELHTETYLRIGNEFLKEKSSRDLKFLKRIKSGYVDKKIIENTNAKYFTDILRVHNPERLPEKVIALLKYPFIEKLYKAGWMKYADILCNCALDSEYSLDRKINELFLNTNSFYSVSLRKLEIHMLFKLNKHQTEILKNYSNENEMIEPIIHYLKYCLNDDLSSIDNNKFDKVFDWIIDLNSRLDIKNKNDMRYIFYAVKSLNNVFSLNKSIEIMEEFIDSIKHAKDYETLFISYSDVIHMLDEINLLKNYNIKIANEFQLDRLHRDVVEIYNSIKKEYENAKFIEKLEKIKYLEFEDKNYKIVIPKDCEDLINEGAKLHHCVASYISKVIDNHTNIVFIRKIESPEVPFFTVEVSNYKTIEQIHGFGNCNVEDENLKAFIDRWVVIKDLTLNDINKVR